MSQPWIGWKNEAEAEGLRPVSDFTIDSLHTALRGLSTRQRVIANNLANSETPGYRAGTVSFEDSLRTAMRRGEPKRTTVAQGTSTNPVFVNGNNVELDEETVALVETGMRYQLLTQAVSSKYSIIRTAIGRGA